MSSSTVKIDLLGIKPMHKDAKAVGIDIRECHALGGAFGEITVKRRREEGRIVAHEVFVDDEGLFRIFKANDDCYHTLRTSVEWLTLLV